MANLITEKQKKIIGKEYLMRVFSISLFIPTSLLGIFLLAYIIPYYIAVNKKAIIVSEQFEPVLLAENKENVGESSSRIVSQTLNQMKVIDLYNKNSVNPSIYFNKIIENKNSRIDINKLSFNVLKKGQGQIFVSGISEDRDGLVVFIEDLKSKTDFVSVESPVSDFAKDKNISFTLNIKLNI